ncbi:MAG TPA: class II aldolase/adducin family protein, partial [Hyphomicrobiales bacterium]|nr:class II aldolase/adducin family protein [Hyphomicrobiales bacterium]
MRAQVTDYCAHIGADPLLVQGAGGNVSWKEDGTLWIKASGKWLANAWNEDIFVPVELQQLRGAIASDDFNATPRTLPGSRLRPSIETMLHALFEHPIVVHVHAVEILVHLVRPDAEASIRARMGPDTYWIETAYHKPGPDLASALKVALTERPSANVAFLQNHGVVAGGASIAEVSSTLSTAIERFKCPVRAKPPVRASDSVSLGMLAENGYQPVPVPDVQELATAPAYFDQLGKNWALYPDHVVFLGAAPHMFESAETICKTIQRGGQRPELIFVKGAGVFEREPLGAGKYAYLQCYYDVLSRQPGNTELVPLTDDDISALLNWDAEKFRQASNA